MVCRRSGWPLESSRCSVISKALRLARPTRVGHPVPDVAAPAAKVFRIGADPGASIDNHLNGRQAELRHSAWAPVAAPGFRPRRTRVAPQQRLILRPGRSSVGPSCLHATSCTARPAKSPTVSRRPQSAIAHQGRRDVSDRPVHAAKPTDAVPFPIISIGGTGTTPPRNRSSRCHPAAVRLNRPTGSSDSSTSPRRSFLTSRQSRSFARVGIMPRAKLYSTRSSRLCRRAEATR